MRKYKTKIGLEIHAQLSTKSKMFCGCENSFAEKPNSRVCPVCLGFPGSLPVVNQKSIEFAVMLGSALHCEINKTSSFDRKNYFYPDLPKGYQITQFNNPICNGGFLELNSGKKINLERIHLEEDSGKTIHDESFVEKNSSYLDFNRAGIPLAEIVTKPELTSAEETHEFLVKLRRILRYLEICDGNMQDGSLRCDLNISVNQFDEENIPNTKVEVKNLNSFKGIQSAIKFEEKRQKRLLEKDGIFENQTRMWNEDSNTTELMRKKEEEFDYRYFPEPDLLPIKITDEEIKRIKNDLPVLPKEKRKKYISEFNLNDSDAELLIKNRQLGKFFEDCLENFPEPSLVLKFIRGQFLSYINKSNISVQNSKINPQQVSELLRLVQEQVISWKASKKVFELMQKSDRSPSEIVEEENLKQMSDEDSLRHIIRNVLHEFEAEVKKYKQGQTKLFHFFVGQVMKKSKGKANPQEVSKILKNLLKKGVKCKTKKW